ncbi:NfeD family protein [Marinilabiliaceae bacterium JC017]|nr:NfeD family protein [Marinilabiliaceae bacterium JC017]
MEFLSNPVLAWFLVGLVLLFLEFLIPGVLVLFFGVGAWLTALACLFFDISLGLQFFIFGISSVCIMLMLRKRIMTKLYKRDAVNDPDEEFIGQIGVCEKKIIPNDTGKVAFKGTSWNASSPMEIAVGKKVRIIGKEGLSLIVQIYNEK